MIFLKDYGQDLAGGAQSGRCLHAKDAELYGYVNVSEGYPGFDW